MRRLQAVATYGTLQQRTAENATVVSSYVALSRPDGALLKLLFPASSLYREEFTRIYATKEWGEFGGGSGWGSTTEYTEVVRAELAQVVRELNITSLLDSSCGSMHWMPLALANITASQPGFRFMGTDVTCDLID